MGKKESKKPNKIKTYYVVFKLMIIEWDYYGHCFMGRYCIDKRGNIFKRILNQNR